MRYIQPQPDIALTDVEGKPIKDSESGEPATVTFERFLLGRLTDPSFAKDMDAVLSAVQIKEAIKAAKGGVVALESADWERLRDATKKPQGGYIAMVAHCLAPYMKAVRDASEKPPTAPHVTVEDAASAGAS